MLIAGQTYALLIETEIIIKILLKFV